NRESDCSVDLWAFSALLAACDRHTHRRKDRCRSCLGRMEDALALYRGSFLEGFSVADCGAFQEWILMKQERVRQLALGALSRLAERRIRQGEPEQAYAYAVRQLEIDPWREEAHRQAMQALALSGERTTALE